MQILIFDNMEMPDRTKVCPRCGGEMWQGEYEMVECLACFLWGWLPDNDDRSIDYVKMDQHNTGNAKRG